MPDHPAGLYARRGKRCLDLTVALVALLLLSPLLLAVAGLVRLRLGSPVLFRQERVGRDERVFRLLKFRTMTDARDAAGRLLPDEARLTPLGLALRRWSLDELPQLWNVLRGEMSLIGPRPLLVRYLPRYTPHQRQRHRVRPGITGWAQANGRNSLGWEERFERDVWYVRHLSLAADLRIVRLTLLRGLRRSEVAPGGGAEVEEFWGTAGRPPGARRSLPAEEDGVAEAFLRPRAGERLPATVVPWEEADLPVVTEAVAAARKRGLGRTVVPHLGRWWLQVAPGFYQPVALATCVSPAEATRPVPWCWGLRACLAPEHAHRANATTPVHLMPDLASYGPQRLSRRRRQLVAKRLKGPAAIVVLQAPDILLEQGYGLVREARSRKPGLRMPDRGGFERWARSFFSPPRGLVVAAVREGRLLAFDTYTAVAGVLYGDTSHAGEEARSARLAGCLSYAAVGIASRTPGLEAVADGLHAPENPGLDEFKRSLGFRVTHLPALAWLAPGAGPLLRRLRPHVHYRVTGRG